MDAIEILKKLQNTPCKTPTKLQEEAFKYTVGTSKIPVGRILNALANYDCDYARYWINQLKQYR